MKKTLNFYAGPAILPQEVFKQVAAEMVDYKGSGLSLMETSHRSKTYDEVHNQAIELIKKMFSVPENYHIMFVGGGATLQFGMIPLNFLPEGGEADYTITGEWAKKACADAKKVGKVKVVFDGADNSYNSLPDETALPLGSQSAYLHITSNETIGGIQWQKWPSCGYVPLICDMSSDILSRRVPVDKFAMIYAGAQKNLAPSGVTLLILRKDMIDKCPDNLPAYLNYKIHAEKNSLYNTPPVFSIYVMKLVLEKMFEKGGLPAFEEINQQKADLLYKTIDESDGFYRNPVEKPYRSKMNVTFRLQSEELEKKFLSECESNNMVGLKGHRSVGGCRASIYNSMSYDSVAELCQMMRDFSKKEQG